MRFRKRQPLTVYVVVVSTEGENNAEVVGVYSTMKAAQARMRVQTPYWQITEVFEEDVTW